jgi:hypothetical protein
MQGYVFNNENCDPDEEIEIKKLREESNKKANSIYENSKFYRLFRQIIENTKADIEKDQASYSSINELYNPSFVTFFLEEYMSELPLWNKCVRVLRFMNNNLRRSNNGSVERYFGVKKKELRKESFVPLGSIRLHDYIGHLEEQIKRDVGIIR